MERLAADALAILDVAANGLRAGHPPSALTFLVGPGDAMHVLVDSDWPLSSLQREYGSTGAYRIHHDRSGVSVEGRDLSRSIQFRRDITTAGPCQPEEFLQPPRWEPLLLSASRALLTASGSA